MQENRRRAAADPDLDLAYAGTLMELARVAENQGLFDEALMWSQRSEHVLECLVDGPQHRQVIPSIDQSRRMIAGLLARDGRGEERRKLVERHLGMLEHLSKRAGCDPEIGLQAALIRFDLDPSDDERTRLCAVIQQFPAGRRHAQLFQVRVAQWIAVDVPGHASGRSTSGESTNLFDPDTYARDIIRALEARCKTLGVYPGLLSAAAYQVASIAGQRGAEQRKAGRLDAAPDRGVAHGVRPDDGPKRSR